MLECLTLYITLHPLLSSHYIKKKKNESTTKLYYRLISARALSSTPSLYMFYILQKMYTTTFVKFFILIFCFLKVLNRDSRVCCGFSCVLYIKKNKNMKKTQLEKAEKLVLKLHVYMNIIIIFAVCIRSTTYTILHIIFVYITILQTTLLFYR